MIAFSCNEALESRLSIVDQSYLKKGHKMNFDEVINIQNQFFFDFLSQYTGDFRFENVDLSTLTALHDSEGHVLPLDEMYLDTTFCTPTYKHFPSREESLSAIWSIVTGWIKKNGKYRTQRPKHVVLFQLPGNTNAKPLSLWH